MNTLTLLIIIAFLCCINGIIIDLFIIPIQSTTLKISYYTLSSILLIVILDLYIRNSNES